MSDLYKQMAVLRLLRNRLEQKTHTQNDIDYLAAVLTDIVKGVDANKAFKIDSTQGVKRSQYLPHQRISMALHMMMGYMYETEEDYQREFVDKGGVDIDTTMLTRAARKVGAALDIPHTDLYHHWYNPDYQYLKDLYRDESTVLGIEDLLKKDDD